MRRNEAIPPRLPRGGYPSSARKASDMAPPPRRRVTATSDAELIVIRFKPPGKLLNMNDRMHWAPKAGLVKSWRERAGWAAVQLKLGGRLLPKSTVSVVLPVRAIRRRDPHNFTPTLKAIIDGLVDVGVFPDDDETHVVTTEPGFTRYGTDVVVTITPFAAGAE